LVRVEGERVLAACAQWETPSALALDCGEEKRRKSMLDECAQENTTLQHRLDEGRVEEKGGAR